MFELDIVFKTEYTRIVAMLVGRFGHQHLDIVEDAIQEAFYKALRTWPQRPPNNPKGWIVRVTQNHVLDRLKRAEQKNVRYDGLENPEFVAGFAEDEYADENEIRESQLKMIFACCHPELSAVDQLILNLKFNCGFGVRQIARALMRSSSAIEKAVTRAKARLQATVTDFEIPPASELHNRLAGVMKVVYLQFNEGYKTSEGDVLINKEVCLDAIALAKQLAEYPALATSELNALIALMYFQASRLDSRVGPDGRIVTLQHQDRSKWNHGFIREGNIHMGRATGVRYLTNMHVEAIIASYHCVAETYEATDWGGIAELYRIANERQPNPHYVLNRGIALGHFWPPAQTLAYIEQHRKDFPANTVASIFYGDVLLENGDKAAAKEQYSAALAITANTHEQAFISEKIAGLEKPEAE